MLFIAAVSLLMPARRQTPPPVIARVNPAIGHLGLTLIALIYVLLSVWQA